MKFFNIRYPKTDFINQNINQLASFLMMAILKNDPTRIKDILDDKIVPYLEIYGVKYEVKEGSAFEDFFLTLTGRFRDMPKIRNSDDFKNYMIKLINVGKGIESSGGDRSQYPGSGYYGDKRFEDATDSEISEIIDSLKKYSSKRYIILSTDDIYDIDDLKEKGISLSSNSKYVNSLNYDNLYQLKLPFRKKFLEKDGYIDLKKWFEYLSEISDKDFYEHKGDTYLVISIDGDGTYSLVEMDDFSEIIYNKWYDSYDLSYDDDHKFIDFDYYNTLTFEEVSEKLFMYDNSVSIMRRNFRDNDIIANNTKLGGVYKSYWDSPWKQKEIDLKGNKNYTDFTSDRQDKVSISKNVITNNGKKLISVLNSIRGYAIKNYKELKNRYKSNKFTKGDISIYQNLDYYYLTNINNMYNLQYNLSISLNECEIKLSKTYEP